MLPPRSMPRHPYPLLARAWAFVFLAVGLGLALAPDSLCDFINGIVAASLGGEWNRVREPRNTLGHPLAVAYMAVITVLAWQCSVRPERREPYIALLTAKLGSTAFFLANGLPVWFLLAAGDAFVALTLFLARRDWAAVRPAPGLPDGYARAWEGRGPRYEVWFGKLDLGPGRAFWFRYQILDGVRREASVWGILFDEDESGRSRVTARREVFPLQEPEAWPRMFACEAGSLAADHATGRAGELSWDLRWTDRGLRFSHVPAWVRALTGGRNVATSPVLDLRAEGTVRRDGEEIPVRKATGMIGHHHGRALPVAWAWTHCNRFDSQEDAVFEGFVGRGKVGPWQPTAFGFLLRLGAETFLFPPQLGLTPAMLTLLDTSPVATEGRWRFEARSGDAVLTGHAQLAGPERVVTLAYEDTDGSTVWCRNSKLSDLELRLVCPSRGIDRFLRATGTAAFEWADRETPTGAVTLGRTS